MTENRPDLLTNSKNSLNQNLIVSKRSSNSNINSPNHKIKNEQNNNLQKIDKFSSHNVYADDPLKNSNIIRTNQLPLIIENPSTRTKQNKTKGIGSSYERRRFSINSTSTNHHNEQNYIKQNAFNTPEVSFNLANLITTQKNSFSQNQTPITSRNRLSFDEIDIKKNVSKFFDSEHFDTPSTSSSSSGKLIKNISKIIFVIYKYLII